MIFTTPGDEEARSWDESDEIEVDVVSIRTTATSDTGAVANDRFVPTVFVAQASTISAMSGSTRRRPSQWSSPSIAST